MAQRTMQADHQKGNKVANCTYLLLLSGLFSLLKTKQRVQIQVQRRESKWIHSYSTNRNFYRTVGKQHLYKFFTRISLF